MIGGVSAGVGSWISGTGSGLMARAGAAAVDMVGSGIVSVAGYLSHEPNPSVGGALTAFGMGAGAAAVFMGAGAVASRVWNRGSRVIGFGGRATKHAPELEVTVTTPGSAAELGPQTILTTHASDSLLSQYAKNITPFPGYYDVVIHGTPDSVWLGDQSFNHRWLARYLRRKGYQGEPLRLISCETGKLEDGFAQNLANKLGVEVLAPTDKVWVFPDGRMTIGSRVYSNTGSWKVFRPRSR